MYNLFCGCGLKMVVGVHVYDWMYELYITMHEAPFCRGTPCHEGVVIEAQTVVMGQKYTKPRCF